MTTPTIHVNPTEFDWTDATTNTDSSAIVAGEVTGFVLGIRPAAGSAGTYPTKITVADAAALKVMMSAVAPALPPAGSATQAGYAAAIMSTGPNPSAWSPVEYLFSIVPPTPLPPSFSNA